MFGDCLLHLSVKLLNSWRRKVLMKPWKEKDQGNVNATVVGRCLVCKLVGGALPKDMRAEWMPMQMYWNSISSALRKSTWHRTYPEVNVLLHSYRHWIQWMNNKLVVSRAVALVSQKVPTFDLYYQQEQGPGACNTAGFVRFRLYLHRIAFGCITLSRLFCLPWQCCASSVWWFGMQFRTQE